MKKAQASKKTLTKQKKKLDKQVKLIACPSYGLDIELQRGIKNPKATAALLKIPVEALQKWSVGE